MKIKHTIILLLGFLLSQSIYAHSKALTPEFVDTLVKPYLQIQAALAGDDFAKSTLEAKAFLVALEEAPVYADAEQTVAALKKSSTNIHTAEDIQKARVAFLPLSKEMQVLIEHVGTVGKEKLYLGQCPMAFNYEGGSWVQSSEQVSNPYFGASMLTCGSTRPLHSGH